MSSLPYPYRDDTAQLRQEVTELRTELRDLKAFLEHNLAALMRDPDFAYGHYQSVDTVKLKAAQAAQRDLQERMRRETEAAEAAERLREKSLQEPRAAGAERAVEDDTKEARGRRGVLRHAFGPKEAKKAAKKA